MFIYACTRKKTTCFCAPKFEQVKMVIQSFFFLDFGVGSGEVLDPVTFQEVVGSC